MVIICFKLSMREFPVAQTLSHVVKTIDWLACTHKGSYSYFYICPLFAVPAIHMMEAALRSLTKL